MSDADRARRSAVASIRTRTAAIRRRELATALRRLDERGGLTPDQRAAVAAMTDGIVEGLLAAPETALGEADDPETVAAVERVFGGE